MGNEQITKIRACHDVAKNKGHQVLMDLELMDLLNVRWRKLKDINVLSFALKSHIGTLPSRSLEAMATIPR